MFLPFWVIDLLCGTVFCDQKIACANTMALGRYGCESRLWVGFVSSDILTLDFGAFIKPTLLKLDED